MNLAIIIAVSKHTNPNLDRPACANDGRLVANIIKQTRKFDQYIVIDHDTTRASVKKQLEEFISQHHGEAIDELFLFYSGHGDVLNNEFCFVMSDYNDQQPSKTSLKLSELDALLMRLCPALDDQAHQRLLFRNELS